AFVDELGGTVETTPELGGVVELAEFAYFFRATHLREAVGVGLDTEGIEEVAEVLVDRLVGDVVGRSCRVRARVDRIGAAVVAVAKAVSATERLAPVLEVHGLAELEVATTAADLEDRQVVEVVRVAVGELLAPHGGRAVEERTVALRVIIHLPDEVGELLGVETVDLLELPDDASAAVTPHDGGTDAVRQAVVLGAVTQTRERVVRR